jgi:hypothetical protein
VNYIIKIMKIILFNSESYLAQPTVAPVAAPKPAAVAYAVPVMAADCNPAIKVPAAIPLPILAANNPPATGPRGDNPTSKNAPVTAAAPTRAPTAISSATLGTVQVFSALFSSILLELIGAAS